MSEIVESTNIAGFDWSDVSYKTTEVFRPVFSKAKVVKVYDGDTITVATPLQFTGSPVYRFSVRIRGIDCPEIRTKDADEKVCGQKAKKIMLDQVMNKVVDVSNIDYDKYGRILADVSIDGVNVTEALIKQNLAVVYNGGKKNSPENWLDYHKQYTGDQDKKVAVPSTVSD
jgi:micrococcal nuclease